MVISVPTDEKVIIRTAKDTSAADRDELIALWKVCFDDTPEFIEFFFVSFTVA